MKYIIYGVIVLSLAAIVFNITKLDFSNLFSGDSLIAIIGIVSLLCTICLMLIADASRRIKNKKDKK